MAVSAIAWSLDIFCGRLVNLGRALVEVKPGPSGRVTDPLSRPRLPVAARVPARAQLPPCAASSFGLVDRRGHGHAHAHPGRLRFGPADWSADYRLQARSEWQEQALFDALLPAALAHCAGRFVPVAVDDTRLKKTGKRIPMTFYQRDPLSPPFHVNLQRGLRFLQASLLLPLHRKHKVNAR